MKKILIIDDSSVLQNLLLLPLSYGGYKVVQATNSIQALEFAERDKPEIVILNAMMFDVDGFEMCKRIKALPALSNCFVLISTPFAKASGRAKALDACANYYLPQPFCPTELMSILTGV